VADWLYRGLVLAILMGLEFLVEIARSFFLLILIEFFGIFDLSVVV